MAKQAKIENLQTPEDVASKRKQDIFNLLEEDSKLSDITVLPSQIFEEEKKQKEKKKTDCIEEVPAEEVEKEKEVLTAQSLNEGKPANVVEKMVEGRIHKFYKEICLLEQDFVKDPSKTVKEVVNEAILAIGEKINIRRFTRYEMGEGLEKRDWTK